ncbi:hypothetical protein, partial [Streptomyces hiroshimensis]
RTPLTGHETVEGLLARSLNQQLSALAKRRGQISIVTSEDPATMKRALAAMQQLDGENGLDHGELTSVHRAVILAPPRRELELTTITVS